MLSLKFIERYFREDPPKHIFYGDSVDIHNELLVHAKGYYPQDLIETARPNEADEYKEYRKSVFTPVTKTWFSKVVKTISKINKAEDWHITWKESVGAIPEDETLQKYCEVNYPYFDSFENWTFSMALPMMLEDPDGVIAVYPLPKLTNSDTEYYRPYTHYYNSERVIDFMENEYAVLIDERKSTVTIGGNPVQEGRIYHFFDKEYYVIAEQFGEKDKWQFRVLSNSEQEFEPLKHGIGYLPVIKLGGVIKDFKEGDMLYESFIGDCLNNWKEAIRRYSDHQVNMVLHLHPFEWEIADTPCRTCNGTGREHYMHGEERRDVTCGKCLGTGSLSVKTPFGRKLIKPAIKAGLNDHSAIPTPPAGIIERDVNAIDFLKKEYESQIWEGLAAVNMEWIMESPLSTSGESKKMDRQESKTFLHEVARHLVVNVMYPCLYFISKWRYTNIDETTIEQNLPVIKIPVKYDLSNAEMVGARLKVAIESKFSPLITNSLQIEYAKKELGDDCTEVKKMECQLQLDPLPNKTVDEKMTDLASKSISLESYIISENLTAFIERAMYENKDFLTLKYDERVKIMKKYAAEIGGVSEVPLVDENGMPTGSNVNTPVDVEAEAKAKLKGSVGGVQGILEIQKSVAEGITDIEAAVVLMEEIYGFTPEKSRQMLGKPKAIVLEKQPVNGF